MPLEKVTEIFTCYIGMLKHTDSQALIDMCMAQQM